MRLFASAAAISSADPISARSTQRAATLVIHREALFEPGPEGSRFAKGLVSAIGLEAAVAICVYAAWQAWHMFR